jgi:hypothetical protein
VHCVFTRIRSGAIAVDSYGGAIGSTILSAAAVCTSGDFWLDPLEWLRMHGVKTPKGFSFYVQVNGGPSNGRMDKSALG